MVKSKSYVAFDPGEGYPTGKDLYYECGICGAELPSLPQDSMGCRCGNIFIDVGVRKMAVEDDSKIKAFAFVGQTDDSSRLH